MPEPNRELGRAVAEVLRWMGTTPETAAVALGLNPRTLRAMAEGIVPMRSLVLRFAEGVRRAVAGQPASAAGETSGESGNANGVPAWWGDADAWLALAGYAPRREEGARPAPPGDATERAPGSRSGGPPPEARSPAGSRRPTARPESPRPAPASPTVPAAPEPPAHACYRPVYERRAVAGTYVHVFRLETPEGETVFEISMPAEADYRARAAQVKQDLAALTRSQFERKYGRFRVSSEGGRAAGRPPEGAPAP